MPRIESIFLLLPAELRHGIYLYLMPDRVHIHRQADKLYLSACLEPDRSGDDDSTNTAASVNTLDGHEGKFSKDGYADLVWARRLRSTWGPHWRCEENAMDEYSESKFDLTFLLVCKRTYIEFVDLLARTAVVHITDLETVNCLHEDQRAAMPSTFLNIFPSLLREVTRLNITLRLPLRLYQSLERPEEDSEPALAGDMRTWSRLGSTLSQLKNLTRLRIWLDHDEPCSWSVVNERAILSPLIQQASSTEGLDISVYLPKLHPRFEREDRHFISESPASSHLHRILRQRWHFDETGYFGRPGVIHKPDFPFLIDIVDFALMPMAEVEEMERPIWRAGEDVEHEVKEVNQMGYHELP